MFGTREFRFSYTDKDGNEQFIYARNQWLAQKAVATRGGTNVKRAPLPKKLPEHVGTCQICGREIGTKTGLIAHHGYTRPGTGWQTASCYGAKHVAYEVGHDALDSLIPIIAAQIERRTVQIADWLANPPATITFMRDTNKYDRAKRRYEQVEVTVERPADFEHKADAETRHFNRDSYAAHYASRLWAMEQQQKLDQQDLTHFTKRRADWKAPA